MRVAARSEEGAPPDPARDIEASESAIAAAAGDVSRITQALVGASVDLTDAFTAALFELQGGMWVRTGVAGVTDRPMTFSLALDQAPTQPMLVADVRRDPHPVALIAATHNVGALAVVPLQLRAEVPALLAIAARDTGGLAFADLATLSMLAITAVTAANRTSVDPTSATHAVEWLAWHQQALAGIARGVTMDETLRRVCLEVEARYPGARCSVLLADNQHRILRHAAGPNLPPAFRTAIDGLDIADGVGACGTAAATGRPVVVEDVLADPKTVAYTELAEVHGLRSVWSFPLLDAQGDVVGTFALYRDHPHVPTAEEMAGVAAVAGIAGLAIERFRTERALTEAAHRDPLTALGNRAMFHNLLAYALSYARQTATSCAVLFLDLDGFKVVNDSLGHAAGDRMLVDVADRLTRLLGDTTTIARFGGDEFTILVEDASLEKVNRIADGIDAALVEPFEMDGGEFFLTTAIGIAISDGETNDPGSVVRDADAAMYAAKGRGRGRRATFDRALRDRAVARVAMEGELRRAIREDLLEVVYQPLMQIGSKQWCGAEALLRWSHPTLGAVSPTEFIPLAEELGLIGALGEKVLDAAMTQAKAWDDAGIGVPIAINVSASQLTDPGVASEVLGAMRRSGVRSDLIYLELTESAVMENPELAKRLLSEFREAGIRSVIDDFGTGHSSIARLSELPVSGVKIDKSFLELLGIDDAAARIVAAIVDLSHAFGLVVTAEGVETPIALDMLRELGCDQAQGFLFGRPSPPEELGPRLGEHPSATYR